MSNTINVGILAHADAGKTTLTEQMLFLSGSIRSAGSVDDGTASTDSLSVERRRGISVKTALTSLCWNKACINIIDTPGHSDFISEVERAFAALDLAVLVISAVEGIEPQTEILLETLLRLKLPFIVFLNKTDRAGSDFQGSLRDLHQLCAGREPLLYTIPAEEGTDAVQAVPVDFSLPAERENAVMALGNETLMDALLADSPGLAERIQTEINKAFEENRLLPVFCGATKYGRGVAGLLDFLSLQAKPLRDPDGPSAAVIVKAEHDKKYGKLLYVRMLSGTLRVRQALETNQGTEKIARLQKPEGRRLADTDCLYSGETGVLYGISAFRAGDIIGDAAYAPEAAALPVPTLTVQVSPEGPADLPGLQKALSELSDEDPRLDFRYIREKKELHLSIYGEIQTEILQALLSERYGLSVRFSPPSVIYKETPSRAGEGFDAYTMPKPCWAVLRFLIEPLPEGSGLQYASKVTGGRLPYRYQEHVKTAVPRALAQGLHGWQVTDLRVTLIDGESHHIHTHPLDFFLATPLAIMDGLRNTGTAVLEPVNLVTFRCPEAYAGKTLGVITNHRGVIVSQQEKPGRFSITAEIPVSECLRFAPSYPSLTSGTGMLSTRFSHYVPCPDGLWQERERMGVNPLERPKYILWMRGALQEK